MWHNFSLLVVLIRNESGARPGQEISGYHLIPGEFSQGAVCSSTELLPTSASPPPSPGPTVPHGNTRAIVSPPVDPQIWKGRIGGLSWLCDAWFQASAAPKKERSHFTTYPSWLEMIKLGKFPAFLGHKSLLFFFFFAYFLKLTPTLSHFMLKMIRSQIFCKNSHWKGVKTLDLWSVQYFSHPNHCNFQSKILEKVLILKLYNLAHFILALWPLRLPRALLEKWCVSVKSVCYFNSVLLWWFEVCTAEINYQSQSRQSHGLCYRLRNWTVKNIHCLHFMLIRIQEKFKLSEVLN